MAKQAGTGFEQKILLVHGDTETRRSLTSGFQSAGYTVHAVVRTSNAEKVFLQETVDAIVVALADQDGFTSVRELRAKAPGVPILVLLPEPSMEAMRAAYRLGAFDVLTDPPAVTAALSSLAPAMSGKCPSSYLVSDIPVQDVVVIHRDEEPLGYYVQEIGWLGHSVAGAASVEALPGRRGKKQPSIVLFSVTCWRQSGPDYVRKLAAKGTHLRVVVVGTHRTLRKEDELRASGVQALLVDPVPGLELERVFQDLLNEPPAADLLGDDDVDTQRKLREASKGDTEKAAPVGESKPSRTRSRSPVRDDVIELAETLRSGRARVSSISPVAMELQAMCADGPASMSELVEKIEQDPNLAAATLRAANSVAYRGMPRVLDLRAAGQRLGTRRLGEVSQTEAIKGAYKGRDQGWSRLLMKMWRHTVTTAHAARLLGERLDLPNQGAIYSMALLHNIGEVLIVDLYRKAKSEAPDDGIASGTLVHDMNRHHSPLGALLLKSWDFPPALASIALAHHDPRDLPDGTPLARHAWLIGALSSVVMEGPPNYKETPDGGPPLPTAATVLGIRVDEFNRVADTAHKWWATQGD